MFKKLTGFVLAGALAVCALAPAYAAGGTVRVGGVSRQLSRGTATAENYTFVDMLEICNLLGAVVWEDGATGETVARSETVEARVKPGSSEAKVNGEAVTMPAAARIIDGRVALPLRFAGETFGYSVSWDAEAQEPVLTEAEAPKATPAEQAAAMTVLDMGALDTGATVLGYDEALKRAIEQDSSIKDLAASAEVLDDTRRDTYIYSVWGAEAITSAYIGGLRAISQLDYAKMNLPLQEETLKAAAEFSLLNSLSAIDKIKMNIALLDEDIRLAEFNLENNLELRLELGLASENDVRAARLALEQKQREREAYGRSLLSEKEALALLLGYEADEDVSVAYLPEYAEGGIDLDSLIRKIDAQPSIVIAEREYLQAKYEYDTSTNTNDLGQYAPQENKAEKGNAMAAARRAYEDAKTNMEKNIRSAYNSIVAGEETHRSLQLALDKARDDYAAALVNLDAGLVTQYQVDMARAGILKAETDLMNNVYSLDSLRFMIERPYMLGSAG